MEHLVIKVNVIIFHS